MKTENFAHCILIIIVSITQYGCFSRTKYGVQDDQIADTIRNVNKIIELRRSHDYNELEGYLLKLINNLSSDNYAVPRLYSELAEIYSYYLLDIEKAMEFDQKILNYEISDIDYQGRYIPKNTVANEVILGDQNYIDSYMKTNKKELIKIVTDRLNRNNKLIDGEEVLSKNYKIEKLKDHISSVKKDIYSDFVSTADRKMLISRLIKDEYEIKKIMPNFNYEAFKYIINREISIKHIDLREIDYLSLSNYFSGVYKQTDNIKFAEYALEIVYTPYINMRNSASRWNYNVLINKYISLLIEANYKRANYEEMLYYINLNKSRMLIEDRLILNEKDKNKINHNAANEDLGNFILPSKEVFFKKISTIDKYLDFYVDGYYQKKLQFEIDKNYRATSPLTTRDFSVASTNNYIESFVGSSIFITYINQGKIIYVDKIKEKKLNELREQLDSSLIDISLNKKRIHRSVILEKITDQLILPSVLAVSPDKWISRHPLDFHLHTNVIHSVNLFMKNDDHDINHISILGFLNPTLDLSGAEQEAKVIHLHIPTAQLFLRETAQLDKLRINKEFNVIHLSMHGSFNNENPQLSKLYFAGARRGMSTNDKYALYAKNIGDYPSLAEKDLIFAAACESGIISPDIKNENEFTGILRPLISNKNKNIILSLWKIDDHVTEEFVSFFYQKLVQSNNIRDSFLFAKSRIRNNYSHPYYWAAFYLLQAN